MSRPGRPDCKTAVGFPGVPGGATCAHCGLRLYVTDNQAFGRYPDRDWTLAGSKAGEAAYD